MKKSMLVLLSFLLMATGIACAKTTSNSTVAAAIKSYKGGNYALTYDTLTKYVEKDKSNALAYYYLAISAVQLGKRDEAINNYAKVIDLSTNRRLTNYAQKGKKCIESPSTCNEPDNNDTDMDKFIRTRYYNGFSKEAQCDYEQRKIDNLKREINRDVDITPARFKEYKDFSSEIPTNDEIVYAIKVLQRAGLSDYAGNRYYSDISMLNYNNKNNERELFNMLTGNNNNLSPQVIQSLLTNQLTAGF